MRIAMNINLFRVGDIINYKERVQYRSEVEKLAECTYGKLKQMSYPVRKVSQKAKATIRHGTRGK